MTTSDEHPKKNAGYPSDDALECLAYPVEAPLTAHFDSQTGVLVLESTFHRGGNARSMVRLRLDFSPNAAHGFVRLLKAVETELGMAITERGRLPPQQ